MSFPPFKHPLNAVCVDTWNRLKDSERFRIRQGEETLTENLMLKIWRGRKKRFRDIRVIQTPRHIESKIGSDWEWWIGRGHRRLHYAVQAKRLRPWERRGYTPCNSYGLDHKVRGKGGSKGGSRYQRDHLESYAKKVARVIPLYAFYNYISKGGLTKHHLKNKVDGGYWGCCQPAKARMLGFTVTPLESILRVVPEPQPMTFDEIHRIPETIPVRCLACPRGQAVLFGGTSNRNKVMADYAQPLPAELEDGVLPEKSEHEYFSKKILIIEGQNMD